MKNRIVLLVFLLMVGVAVSIGVGALVEGAAASSDSTDTRLEEFIPTEKVPADHAILERTDRNATHVWVEKAPVSEAGTMPTR